MDIRTTLLGSERRVVMSEDNVQEQLRALAEQVRQLQAENSRLRDNGDSQEEGSAPSTSGTPAAVSSQPVSEHYVFVPRERKCPTFSAKNSCDLMSVEDWIEEARRCLSIRRMLPAEQALFLFDHLDGEAKAEMKFHSVADRNTPDKVFNILLENYACSQVYVRTQQQFYLRTQKEGESVREYSHALKSIMDIAIRKSPEGSIPNSDCTLRDQFVEHLRDDMLRRHLKDKMVASPTMSFMDARHAALSWVDRGKLVSNQRARAHSCDTFVSNCEADANVIVAKPDGEIAEVKEVLRQQQLQLDAILKHLGAPGPSDRGRGPARPYRFRPDGKPICSRCNQDGHIARFCSVDLNTHSGPANRAGPRTFSRNQTTGIASSAMQPSEN